jgi:hypothetical protein
MTSSGSSQAFKRSMHSSLVLGSRVAAKLPQDVACTIIDTQTRARAWVVADGVSECRASPEEVRCFAYEVARAAAIELLDAFVNAEETLTKPYEGKSDKQERGKAYFRERLYDRLSELIAQDGKSNGAACVVGGVLWAPTALWATLFAVGNIGGVLVSSGLDSSEGEKLFGLAGDSKVLLEKQPGSLKLEHIRVDGSWLNADQLAVAVASDGFADPPSAGDSFFGFLAEAERESKHAWLSRLAQAATARGHAVGEALMPDEPLDDATVVVGTWFRDTPAMAALEQDERPSAVGLEIP